MQQDTRSLPRRHTAASDQSPHKTAAPSTLISHLQKQQAEEVAWMTSLRQHHQEQQHDHIEAMRVVNDSQGITSHMRQLAQAEVDWACFRAAVELYHSPGPPQCTCHTPEAQEEQSSGLKMKSASGRAEQAANLEQEGSFSAIGFSFSAASVSESTATSGRQSPCISPRSPRLQFRPYTAPTIVSRQPFHTDTDCPFYVTSLYTDLQHAAEQPLEQCKQSKSDGKSSMHGMREEDSRLSCPQPCSPQPFLKSGTGGVAMTYGTRERDRPQTSSTAEPGIEPKSSRSASRCSTSRLINAMREGVQSANDEKTFSHIVNRSKAWPAMSADHPIASGLTVRQQAQSLGKTSLAHQEEQLAQRYGSWEQELRSFVSCSGPEAQKLSMQADALMATADDAMTPRIYTTGPV